MTEPSTTPFDALLAEARDHLAGLRQLVRDSRSIVEDGGEIVDATFFSEKIAGGLARARARVRALEICASEWRASESADAADTTDEERAAALYWKAANDKR